MSTNKSEWKKEKEIFTQNVLCIRFYSVISSLFISASEISWMD